MSEKQMTEVAEALDPRRWMALGIVLLASIMDLMDSSITTLAIPAIKADLGANNAAMQWIIAGYTLTFAVLLITGGRLGDIFGRKRMFLAGVAGFTIASALSGMAVSTEMLIASRILQGLMAALMVPQVLSTLQVTFPPKERIAAFGMYGAMGGMANVIAPLLAGVILSVNLLGMTWRPLFLINVPVGIFIFIAAYYVVQESKAPEALRLDVTGVGIITVSLLLLMYPLVQGNDLGWPLWTYAAMALSIPGFIAFAMYERHKNRIDRSPLVVPELFRIPAFVAGLIICMVMLLALVAFFFTVSVYMQTGLGYSALDTGFTMLPWPVAMMIGTVLSMKVVGRYGRKLLSAGNLLMAAGLGCLYLAIAHFGSSISSWDFLPGVAIGGFGMGMIMPFLFDYILARVPVRYAGSASGIASTAMQLGSALGVAIIGTVFFNAMNSGFAEAIKQAIAIEIGVYMLAFLLVFFLPGNVHKEENGVSGH
jgi:EmrB/QacA subfamily drug resistance transporter